MVFLYSREIRQLPTLVFVRIKFDEGDVYSGLWFANENMAFYTDEDTVAYILEGISTSDSMKYEITGEISDFDLTRTDGSSAVQNLLERCETLN